MAQTWFITGVSSGLGRSMTEQLLARGDRVAGTVRKLDVMADLKAQYGERLWLAELEVTDFAAIPRVVNAAFGTLGRIDVVVNNAGYGLFGPAEALSDEQVYHQINANLVAPIQVARAALPHLRAQQGGRIIAISTYGGQAAQPGGSLYHASKWGMEGFFDALHGEAAFFDIGVTIVEPGGARTGFRKAASSQAAELDAYRGTPVGSIRARLEDQSRPPIGDPDKMAAAIIASAGQYPAQKRLVLGSDAYGFIQKALTERLAAVEMQKETAASTDIVPGH